MSDFEHLLKAWRQRLAERTELSPDDGDELEDHLRLLIEEQLTKGATLEEAFGYAQRRLGEPDDLADRWVRSPRVGSSPPPAFSRAPSRPTVGGWLNSVLRDLKYTLRTLAQRPGFTVVVVLVLAIGIGVNSAVFSLIHGLVWRPPNLADPERLVVFAAVDDHGRVADGLSYPDFEVYAEETSVIEGMALYFPISVRMRAQDESQMVWGNITSHNYFEALAVEPAIGRGFSGPDLAEDTSSSVVISHALWQGRLAGDPQVLGRELHLNGQPFTVIGVTPAGFRGAHALIQAEFWVSLSSVEMILPLAAELLEDRKRRNIWAVARLAPGSSLEQAQLRFTDIASLLEREYPEANEGIGIRVFPESYARMGMNTGPILRLASIVMLVSVALVLVIACVNVANLVLARSASRRQEIAVRLALGASRRRLLRQLLTESLVLSSLGGLLGLGLSILAIRVLAASASASTGLPIFFDPSIDPEVLLYALLITVATGLFCGMTPALKTTRATGASGLRSEGRASLGTSSGKLRRWLVVGGVAACLVLLVTASLFARSLQNTVEVDVGFQPQDRLSVSVDLSFNGYEEDRRRRFYADLRTRVERLPQVRSATWAMPMPLDTFASNAFVYVESYQRADDRDEPLQVLFSAIDENYFDTLGTPILRGRGIEPNDRREGSRVAVINQTMADRYWLDEDALGGSFRLDDSDGPPIRVVGIAADGKYRRVAEVPIPYVFLPYEQGAAMPLRASLVVHSKAQPALLAEQIRQAARALDEAVMLIDFRTLDEHLSRSAFMPARVAAALVSLFGLLGLSLAVLGLYGLISYSVSRQTRELGLRMALGATRTDIVGMILTQGFKLISVGVAIGLLAAAGASRLVVGLLYNVGALDPISFVGAPPVLVVVALLACLTPALRATRIDPMQALRTD